MTNEAVSYEELMRDEWRPMTESKALELRAELYAWRDNRQAGGYDVRLIEGAIAVCNEYLGCS